ncbi:unnamed protein product [Prorocentrum cordatum]|uniref:Uncharacterized protein n=1 Tax=Prorocentrum cordatum TaxID=2364126 RepID=A0ABN9TBI9_9DINO|nr:unnamed protein product [Polarella glacialis]
MELLSLGALSNIVQIGQLATTARGNTVEQKFQRNLAEVDFRLERQKLHREDVRDLMELTVGRMDLYHVVGTLLLTFCISWYTGNGIITAGLPRWFATLFLINNFCAVGYLIFSVWLAMHASIVAHSISVGLLLRAPVHPGARRARRPEDVVLRRGRGQRLPVDRQRAPRLRGQRPRPGVHEPCTPHREWQGSCSLSPILQFMLSWFTSGGGLQETVLGASPGARASASLRSPAMFPGPRSI